MILIPEQIVQIRKELNRCKLERLNYKEYLKKNTSHNKYIFNGDMQQEDFIKLNNKINMLEQLLDESKKLEEYTTDEIDIGTKAKIIFDDEELLITLIDGEITSDSYYSLVDNSLLKPNDLYISSYSLLGKAMLEKKENDVVYFEVNKNKIKVTIKEILKDGYMYPIRRKGYSSRISQKAKLEKKQGVDYSGITPSQEYLLNQEYRDAKRKINLGINVHANDSRSGKILKLLKETEISDVIDDGTIGLGTIFNITLYKEGQIITEYKNIEMVNMAVSTEYPNEYIERISPLGNIVFGLREGDYFKALVNRTPLIGQVTNVTNKKVDNLETYKNKIYIK